MENPTVQACIELSYKQPEGCLFAIEARSPKRKYYAPANLEIFKRDGSRLSVFNSKDRIVIHKLASLDGAMIINRGGELMHFGATLIHSRNFLGHGKRHAFALGTTARANGVICILASEEDRMIRAFKNGVPVFELDSEDRVPLTTRRKLVELLTSRVTSLVIASGIAASILTVNPVPALVTISGTQIITYAGFEKARQFMTGKQRVQHSQSMQALLK